VRKGSLAVVSPSEAEVLGRELTAPSSGVPGWWSYLAREDLRPEGTGDDRTKAKGADRSPQVRGNLVLVVDDDPDVRIMLRTQLEIEGYDVIEAADGTEAWQIIERKHPPVVIADIQMPRRSGLELCRLARDNHFDGKFIAFTAGMASWNECKKVGFDAHFLKTDPLPLLTKTIRRYLAG
jgi:CheY-like chemotaxis protein